MRINANKVKFYAGEDWDYIRIASEDQKCIEMKTAGRRSLNNRVGEDLLKMQRKPEMYCLRKKSKVRITLQMKRKCILCVNIIFRQLNK